MFDSQRTGVGEGRIAQYPPPSRGHLEQAAPPAAELPGARQQRPGHADVTENDLFYRSAGPIDVNEPHAEPGILTELTDRGRIH